MLTIKYTVLFLSNPSVSLVVMVTGVYLEMWQVHWVQLHFCQNIVLQLKLNFLIEDPSAVKGVDRFYTLAYKYNVSSC